MRSSRRHGFTLIELMIIIALLGVWVVNVTDLLPRAYGSFVRLARDHAGQDAMVRLHAMLTADLREGSPENGGAAGFTVRLPSGEVVHYLALRDVGGRDEVRRIEASRAAIFADVTLSALAPDLPGGAWCVRLESRAPRHRPAPVLVSAWPRGDRR